MTPPSSCEQRAGGSCQHRAAQVVVTEREGGERGGPSGSRATGRMRKWPKSMKNAHLVELFIVADGQLDMAGNDTGLLVVAGRVASELKDLGAEVLEHGGEVDWGASPDARGGSLQVAVDASDRELEPSLGAAGLGSRPLGSLLSASALALA